MLVRNCFVIALMLGLFTQTQAGYSPVLFVRHGDKHDKTTLYDGEKLLEYEGWEVPLSRGGNVEAMQLGSFLMKYIEAAVKGFVDMDDDERNVAVKLIVSPFRRAIQTASCFAARSGLKIDLDRAFAETGCGSCNFWSYTHQGKQIDTHGKCKQDGGESTGPHCDDYINYLLKHPSCGGSYLFKENSKDSRAIFGEERKEVIEQGMEWITLTEGTESTCEPSNNEKPDLRESAEDYEKRKIVYDIPESEKGKSLDWCKYKCAEKRCKFIFHSDSAMKCHVMKSVSSCEEKDQEYRQKYVGDNYQLKSEGFYTLKRDGKEEKAHKKSKFDDKKRREIAVEQIKKVAKREEVKLVIVVFHGKWMGKLTDFKASNWLDSSTCPHRTQSLGALLSPPTGSVRFLDVNWNGNGWVCDGERFMVTSQRPDEVQAMLRKNPIWSPVTKPKVPTERIPWSVQLGGPDYHRIRKARGEVDCITESIFYARGDAMRKGGGDLWYVGPEGGALGIEQWPRKERKCILDFGKCDDGSDKKKERGCLVTGYVGIYEHCLGGANTDHGFVGGPSVPTFGAGVKQFFKIQKGHYSCFHKACTCKHINVYTNSWAMRHLGVQNAALVRNYVSEFKTEARCPALKKGKNKDEL